MKWINFINNYRTRGFRCQLVNLLLIIHAAECAASMAFCGVYKANFVLYARTFLR